MIPGFISQSSVKCVQPPAELDSSQKFNEIAIPIIDRIIPLVELYRSRHLTVRPVIAITGCSGVGKSFFATQLLSLICERGIKAKIVRFDDFNDPELFEGAIETIHPSFDWLLAHAFLQKILAGEEVIEKPAWDLNELEPFKFKENFELKDVELLIFEGEYTLCDEKTYDFVKFSNVRIVIEAEDADIIRWDWERARYLGTDSFSEFTESRKPSLARYRSLLDSMKSCADFIVEKTNAHEYILLESKLSPSTMPR